MNLSFPRRAAAVPSWLAWVPVPTKIPGTIESAGAAPSNHGETNAPRVFVCFVPPTPRATLSPKNSLGGNSKTCLIVNCSPSSFNEAETLSTLRFGSRGALPGSLSAVFWFYFGSILVLLSVAEGRPMVHAWSWSFSPLSVVGSFKVWRRVCA